MSKGKQTASTKAGHTKPTYAHTKRSTSTGSTQGPHKAPPPSSATPRCPDLRPTSESRVTGDLYRRGEACSASAACVGTVCVSHEAELRREEG